MSSLLRSRLIASVFGPWNIRFECGGVGKEIQKNGICSKQFTNSCHASVGGTPKIAHSFWVHGAPRGEPGRVPYQGTDGGDQLGTPRICTITRRESRIPDERERERGFERRAHSTHAGLETRAEEREGGRLLVLPLLGFFLREFPGYLRGFSTHQ